MCLSLIYGAGLAGHREMLDTEKPACQVLYGTIPPWEGTLPLLRKLKGLRTGVFLFSKPAQGTESSCSLQVDNLRIIDRIIETFEH